MTGLVPEIHRAKFKTICLLIGAVLVLGARPAVGQLSPGPLAQAHESLEGLRKCGSCHALGDREVQDKCLACHTEIQAMRDGGRGLHADPAFARCVDCHVEHQGRDFELVHWEGGTAAFDHGRTGFALEGSHAAKDCRACHNVKYVTDPGALRSAGKSFDRTYLGLATACASCHEDIHRGQFKQDCTSCHDAGKWKPAPLFDHQKTAYPLDGRHAQVDCAKCHKPAEAPQAVVFAGLPHASCVDCHRDPHAGALGPRCTDCHTTMGWKQIIGERFDHARTRYPLEGRHAAVSCAKCHGDRGAKPAFAACTDCHRDAHDGAGRSRPGWLTCERCHDVAGFRPARFGLADHDTTTFRLEGAHRAVPCGLCHKAAAAGAPAAPDLAPAAASCASCHTDPHRWQAAAPPACTACHGQDSWRGARYDHAATRFPLTGRHEVIACAACHKPADAAAARPAPAFGGEPLACAGCHRDVHEGTMTLLAAEQDAPDCARCHVTVDWLAENFEHDRDSRFTLAGAHAKVACAACHKAAEGERLVRFRPLAVECAACHAVLPPTGEENR
jgi:hypothetical protein